MADQVLAKLAIQIAANTAQFNTALKQSQSHLSGFVTGIKNIAGTLGIAFGVQQVASFAFEISKLAGEAEGVSAAFNKLPDSEKLLERLKEATAGTVSELDLMKRTVQASNFGIALEPLPDLLKFAALRAQQTGQSVDYLVDSIVTGIGRKSPLILDNLGISAVRLKAQFNGAALEAQSIADVAKAVGRIASEELGKMGEFSENASTKVQRLNAEWENFKVQLGNAANGSGVLADALDNLNNFLRNLSDLLASNTSSMGEFLSVLGKFNILSFANQSIKAANAALEFAANIGSLESAVKDFNQEFGNTPFAGIASDTREYNAALADLEKKADQAGKKVIILSDDLGRVQAVIKPFTNTKIDTPFTGQNVEKTVTTLDSLKGKVKELTDQFEATDITERKQLETTAAKIRGYQQQIAEIEKLLKAQKQLQKPTTDEAVLTKVSTPNTSDISSDIIKRNNDEIIKSLQKLKVANTDTTTAMKGQWIDLSSSIGGAISDIAFGFGQASVSVGNFGQAILKSVIGFAKQLGEILVAAGAAMLAARVLIKSPGLAIAAGAALLAIAGAASAALDRSQQNFNSGGGSSAQQLSRIEYIRDSQRIYIEGELKVKGPDLVSAITNQNRRDTRVKAS